MESLSKTKASGRCNGSGITGSLSQIILEQYLKMHQETMAPIFSGGATRNGAVTEMWKSYFAA